MSSEEEQQRWLDEMERANREIASRFLECFSTDAGEFVLNRLIAITLDRPVLNASSTQFGAGMREGQNELVRQIMQQMKIAREG